MLQIYAKNDFARLIAEQPIQVAVDLTDSLLVCGRLYCHI